MYVCVSMDGTGYHRWRSGSLLFGIGLWEKWVTGWNGSAGEMGHRVKWVAW